MQELEKCEKKGCGLKSDYECAAMITDVAWAWPADAAKHRFFKVEVAMPDGATATDAPGPVGGGE